MKGVYLFFLLASIFLNVQAQEKTDHTPFSFLSARKVEQVRSFLKPLNLQEIYHEDALQYAEHSQFNVARLQPIKQSERIELRSYENDINVWKQTFSVAGAEQLAIKFKTIQLAKGSELFLYSEDDKSIIYVFDAKTKAFQQDAVISKALASETITLEYNSYQKTDQEPVIDIEGIVNFYPLESRANPGFGQSTECEVNVACEEGEGWCNEAQSVVRILIQSKNSYSYCTGSLINNTSQDFTPYILTAEHCGENSEEEDFAYWKFDFNYQSLLCESPSAESEIVSQFKIGCENLAQAANYGSSGSDFRLLRLKESIPTDWNVYYAGWDATDYSSISNKAVSIHHPYGDIKKISTYEETLLGTDAYGGEQNDCYWETRWIETPNGHGITEGGSSGSPLFNDQGLIIGTLATGSSYCTPSAKTYPDYYGKFSKHWDSNGTLPEQQLKVWLDPLNTGFLKMSGLSSNSDLLCGEKYNFPEFVIFPCPANAVINLGNDDMVDLSEAEIEIYNLQGKLILQTRTTETIGIKQINVQALSQGLYVLKAKKNTWEVRKKFVILR